jgi:hypothetical protein
VYEHVIRQGVADSEGRRYQVIDRDSYMVSMDNESSHGSLCYDNTYRDSRLNLTRWWPCACVYSGFTWFSTIQVNKLLLG